MGLKASTVAGSDEGPGGDSTRGAMQLLFCRRHIISWYFQAQIWDVRWPSWPASLTQLAARTRPRVYATLGWEGS